MEPTAEMTAKALARLITQRVAAESELESIFLTPDPQWFIASSEVLNVIKEAGVATTEEIAQWCKEVSNK